MTTAARPTTEQGSHFYSVNGEPLYEVAKKDGSGMRPFTLADARKMDPMPLPSVTTILSILRKPALETWLIENAVLAAMTTPRPPEEPLDAFIERVLHTERVQDQESDIAKKRGIEIHDAIEGYFAHGGPPDEIMEWIAPVVGFLEDQGEVLGSEQILVSEDGYAGRTDLIQTIGAGVLIWDFKTTKKLPKTAYNDHVLQLSAYANAFPKPPISPDFKLATGNIYISTVEPGKYVVCEHESFWGDTYEMGFKPLLKHWQWANNYHP